MFLVRRPTSIQDTSKHIRSIPADFLKFFPAKRTCFWVVYKHQNPHSTDGFHWTYTNSIRGFKPFNLHDCTHYFRHPIYALLSLCHGTLFPNTCHSIFPHDHCSSLAAVLLHPFHILFCKFEIFFKIRLTRLAIVTPRGISIFCLALNYFKWDRKP